VLGTLVHTATLMALTGVLGYCIAYFLVMKVRSPGWRLALFLPSSSRSGPAP
jgi:putative spermidine/putrescine transport system permease protein